jgi:hypothetical protein
MSGNAQQLRPDIFFEQVNHITDEQVITKNDNVFVLRNNWRKRYGAEFKI